MKNVILSIIAVGFLAYADESVTAPPVDEVGSYALNFFFNGELVLGAHVEDSQGNPATDGVVVFQYCSYRGVRRNDITQPDEAPSSACADGSARWVNLRARITVNEDGDAFLNFGLIEVVNVIGFRYKYSRGTGIADWVTDPEDWVR